MRAYENAAGERLSIVKVADGMNMTLDRSALQIHNFYNNRTIKVALALLNFSLYSTSRFTQLLAFWSRLLKRYVVGVLAVGATVEDMATTCACLRLAYTHALAYVSFLYTNRTLKLARELH
jgi:hypothetical protein